MADFTITVGKKGNKTDSSYAGKVTKQDTIVFKTTHTNQLTINTAAPGTLCDAATGTPLPQSFPVPSPGQVSAKVCPTYTLSSFKYSAKLSNADLEDPTVIVEPMAYCGLPWTESQTEAVVIDIGLIAAASFVALLTYRAGLRRGRQMPRPT
jgi:hypothetical protein